jgi:single-stranded DNA-binding protein
MSDPNQPPRYFQGLQQAAFMRLEHAASLKGLLKPFKGKGDLEVWASQCFAMRDELIGLAQRQVLQQAIGHPFHLLPVELAQQTTGAGTTFLRWRRHDRSAMGVALWQALMASTSTPVNLLADLHAIELQRITLNMQISLLHTLGRQAQECASKAAEAEDAYLRRLTSIPLQCAIGDRVGHPSTRPTPTRHGYFNHHGDHTMSTHFSGEGNIGSPPEYREFPNGNDEPRRLLRLNVYFDNPVPTKGGDFEDRGGFWAPVEIWHRDAAHWKDLYQKGMRVLVVGRMEREPWTDNEDQPRETWQVNARSVGILPFRIESVALSPKPQEAEPKPQPAQEPAAPKEAKRRK